jgi:hypothetical protein
LKYDTNRKAQSRMALKVITLYNAKQKSTLQNGTEHKHFFRTTISRLKQSKMPQTIVVLCRMTLNRKLTIRITLVRILIRRMTLMRILINRITLNRI